MSNSDETKELKLYSTQLHFQMKAKKDQVKKNLSPIKKYCDILVNQSHKTLKVSNKDLRLQHQGVIKSDINDIITEIKDLSDILRYYRPNKGLSSGNITIKKDIFTRINQIENSNKLDLVDYDPIIIEESQRLQTLLIDNSCKNEKELIVNLARENKYMNLFIIKLNEMVFLFNLKYFNNKEQFNKKYHDTRSSFFNIKCLLEAVKESIDSNNANEKTIQYYNEIKQKKSFASSSGYANEYGNDHEYNITDYHHHDYNHDNRIDFGHLNGGDDYEDNSNDYNKIKCLMNAKLLNYKTFPEFLSDEIGLAEYEVNDGINHLKKLFHEYYQKSFQFLLDFITGKLHLSGPKINQIQSVFRNKVNDCLENIALMRKEIEDKFDMIIKENLMIKSKDEQLNQILLKTEKENEQLIQKVKEMNNTDFKTYYLELKQENTKFLDNIKDLAKTRSEALYLEVREKSIKVDELRSEVFNLRKEIDILKGRIDFGNLFPYKKNNDDYCEALQEQFNNMKNGFMDKINEINFDHSKKKIELRKQISMLQDEKKVSVALQNLFVKRMNDLEAYFK